MNLLSVFRLRSQKLFRQSKLTPRQCLSIEVLEERAVPAVSGVAFQDFNSNGARDLAAVVTSPSKATVSAAVDRGIGGVTVTAFDALGVNRGTAVTDAFGAYTLTVSGAQTDPLRVEFTTLPAGFASGPRGADSGTAVQFVANGSATNVDFGAVRPVDHSQDNPLVATSVYAFGDQQSAANAAKTTIVAFPYSAGGTDTAGFVNPSPATPVLSVLASQVGTTLGLGYAKQTRDLYAAAYFKRFAGFGPGGTGAIYKVPVPATLPANYQPNATVLADLNAIPGFAAGAAGADLHNPANYDTDNGNTGWAAVGTSSLGGLDVSSDGQFVFVMNLNDRQLYRVPTSGPINSTTVTRASIPLTNPDTGVIASGTFAPGDLRPFAVEYHEGKVYVGVVYTAQTRLANGAARQTARDELLAAVYVVDPATMAFTATPVFTTRLNYPRAQSIYQGRSEWEPWSATYFSTQGNGGTGIAPQPMLTGITFDAQGNLTLGLRDRGADQNGFFTLTDPAQPGQRIEGFTGGDTLRATITTVDNLASGWTLESNARVPNNVTATPATLGAGPQGNNAGPGGGEFFYQESLGGTHAETSIGGTAQIPGSPDVLSTTMDPGSSTRAGGVSFFSTLTGGKVKAYELYHTLGANNPTDYNNGGGTFGKANGMGELVILSDLAPIEVGNRVFFDANGDGVQGANEPGIANVTVRLYDAANAVLATAVTDANGEYIFSSGPGTSTASAKYGVAGLTANTAGFSIRLDNAADYAAGGPLANRGVTKPLNDPSANGTSRDSDATLASPGNPIGAGNFPRIAFGTGAAGQNVHTYDAGFSPPLSLGNRVFLDANNNGLRDATEGGVAGVTVTLFTAAGVSVGAAVTDANGYYLFTGLTGGSYYVELSTIPGGLRSSTGSGVTGGVAGAGPFEGASTPSADTNVDNDDNGTQVGAIVRSTVITLALTTEPTTEGDVGPQTDTAPNDSSNLTLDLGLIRTFSLGNRVWNDANNDGLLNNAEAGIDGVTVRLLDSTGTAILVGGVAVTAVTAGGGYYRFDSLTAGGYVVQIDGGGPLAGYLSSSGTNGSATGTYEPAPGPNTDTDNDDNGSAAGANFRSGVVTLGPTNVEPTTETDFGPGDVAATPNDQSNLTVDFGFYQPLNLGNLVFNDLNNNGVRDAGEPGLANVPVRLFNSVGGLVSSTSTDGSGNYTFGNLAAGGYFVEADLPAGFVTSTGANGQPTGPSEPAPGPNNDIDNDDNGTRVGATQTVRSGTVTLSVGGEPGVAVDGDGTNGNLTVDFGAFVPLNLGNLVWNDLNNNGVRDAGEPGLDGVTVNLYADANGNGIPDVFTPLATTVTAGGGLYAFTGLGQGGYVVGIPTGGALAGLNSSSGTNGSLTGPFEPGAVANNDTDNDDNGSLGGTFYLSGTVTLAPGTEPAAAVDGDGTNGNLTVDFGFYQPLSLGNLVFNDLNNNGTRDAGEPGIANAPVRLFNAANVLVASTTTDGNGNYLFSNLVAGSYSVEVDLPTGFVSSTGASGQPTGPFEPAPSPNNAVDNDDNGSKTTGQTVRSSPVTLVTGGTNSNLTVDFGGFVPLSLGNFVWNDANNSGKFDAGEKGIAGVVVSLYADADSNGVPDGAALASATTDANGNYLFTGLGQGTYVVGMPTGGALAGLKSSSGTSGSLTGPFESAPSPNNDVNNDDNGTLVGINVFSGTVALAAGTEPDTAADGDGTNGNLTVDFGFFQPLSLGNLVWDDFNNDGKFNNAEVGLSKVVVRLLDGAGNPVLGVGGVPVTTTTNAGGQYLFTNLGAGSYVVEVVAPAGYSSSAGVGSAYEPGKDPNTDSTDNDDNGTSAGGQTVRSLPVTLAAGTAPTGEPALTGLTDAVPDSSANYTVDFGLYTPPPMSLGNRVWLDANNNGLRDGTPVEAGVAGVTVTLFTATSVAVAATVTDANGYYLFTNLTPGTYYVELSGLNGRYASSTGTGAAVGVGGTPGPYEGASTPSGNTDVDNDDNGNQVGPIVRSTTITLTPFTEPTGESDVGPQNDAATDLNGNLTLDLGLVRVYSLGNRVWNDANNDGLLDTATEAGIDGVTVRLLKADGTPVLDTAGVAVTTVTVGGGYYAFSDLLAGDYVVQIDGGGPLAGYLSSSGTNGSLTGPFEPAPSPNTDADNDDNGNASGANFRSGVVTLGSGLTEPTGEADVTETPFAVVDDQSNFTVDFGFYQPIALGNLVWNDTNNNGTRDAGEPGLANVPVRLFNSANTLVASTTTDGNGNYLFPNLTAGDYSVEADLPAGFVSSSGTNASPTGPFEAAPSPNNGVDNDDNGTKTTGQTVRSLPVTLTTPGTSNLTVDFGGYVPLNLGNLVWNDLNNNGTRDAGEPGIAGVTVNLYADANADGVPDSLTPITSAVTNGTGNYLFTNLSAGGYVVGIPTGGPLAGLNSSSGTNGSLTGPFEPGAVANNDTDNDDNGTLSGVNTLSGTVTLSVGGEPPAAIDGDGTNGNLTVDFGFYQPLALGNLVFNDLNNNGKRDAGEPGLSKVAVRAFDAAGKLVGTTLTDSNGNYLFTNLTPGAYSVEADLPTGFVSSSGKNGSVGGPFEPAPSPGNGVDNDDNGTKTTGQTVRSSPVTLVTGGTNSDLTVDFGGYAPLSLGDLVFNDANNNGVRDAGEAGLVGVVVRLFDAANNPVGTTTTDISGNYLFTSLNPGDYAVEADLPAGYVTSTGKNGSVTGPFEPAPITNNDVENDDNGTRTTGQTVRSVPVTLSVGGEPGGGNVNLTVDFGGYLPLSLGNRVWDDLNNNGLRDANEPGLAGVTVTLFTAASVSVAATATDSAGYYLFTNLNPNGYYVELSTLPATYVSSTGAAGSVGPFEGASTPSADTNADNDDNGTQVGAIVRSTVVTLAVGTEPTGETDVGIQANNASDASTNLTLDLGLTRTYSLGNRVFLDGNNDGLRNATEAGVDGVTVRLLKADGTPILDTAGVAVTTATANGGYYRFDGLTAGDYRVQVDGTGPLAGLRSSTGASGVAGTPGPFEAAPSPNTDVDDDDNGTQVGVNAVSGVVTLGPGNSEPTAESDRFEGDFSTPDAQSNLTLDFGFFRPTALGNRVFIDANNDGKFDAGDSAPTGPVTLALLDGGGKAVLDGNGKAVTTTSNAAGYYLFTGLNPGQYQVSIPAANFAVGGTLANSLSSTGAGPGSLTGPNEPAPATPVDNADSGTAALGGVLSPVVTLADGTAPTGEPDAATIADPTADTDGNLTVDFGFYQPLTLGNLVFNDLNNNGTRDPGEPGIANVPVRLFNAANVLVGSTTTDANGNYLFTNLTPGDYSVEADLPAGFKASTRTSANPNDDIDNDSNGVPTVGQTVRSGTVTLTPGGEPTNDGDGASGNLTVDFGAFVPLSLGNLVWNDANNNGKFDAGEAGLAKVVVNLYADANADGVPDSLTALATAVTDANGNYLFTNLGQGTYVVGLPTGGVLAGLNSSSGTNGSLNGPFELAPGPNNDVDNDDNGSLVGINFLSGPVTLTPGGEPGGNVNLTVDFGFYQPIALGNQVFNDANNNGKLDAGEVGLANVPVRAFDATGKLVGSTVTDANGNYLFTNLTPGDYAVEADLPTGFVSSSGKNGSPTGPFETAPSPGNGTDNDDNGTKTTGQTVRSLPVTLVTGGTNSNLTVDFGGYLPLSLGNLVFNDINNNGVRDAGEPGLANVPVRAFDAAGPLIGSTTTDANGNYLFGNLTPGNYAVEADLPAGFVTSSGTNGSPTGPFEPAPVTNNGVDNDDNGTKTTGQTVRSTPVNLVPGGTNSNLTVDFGGYQPLSFGNLIWNDLNNNGRFDAGEPGVPNLPVQLFNAAGTLVTTTTTDANGNYLFTNLTPGDYTVGLTPPAGFTLGANAGASPNNGVDNDNNGTLVGATVRSLPVTLSLGGVSGALNPTVDIGLRVPPAVASVSGYAYRDNDLSATYTPGQRADTPLGNVTVTLTGTDRAGNPVPPRTTRTNAQGFYEFTNLPAGNYTITETPPSGFFYHGADNPGSLGGTSPASRTLAVSLNAGDAGKDYDFGELVPADPFGYVYADLNGNGVRNAGEPGIAGVAVTISGTAFAGTPFARPLTPADVPGGLTSVTNSTGRWEFPVMPPGLYSVVEGAVPALFMDGLEQNGDPTAPPPQVGNDRFDSVSLSPQLARGPLNFGELVPESTKRNFLASTQGLTAGNAASLTRADVPMNPAFTVSTGTPSVPAFVAVASGPGSVPLVRVFDYATGGEVRRFLAYESDFTGGVRVATGDVNGDGVPDIVTGIGVGGGPRIRVFSGADGSVLFDQFVYEPTFTGGLFVAAADVNGDGRADIITGTDSGGGPRVRVLDGLTGAVLQDFFAFDPSQRGGVRVSAADFNNDGKADVVATTGPGVPTRVRVFGAGVATTILADFAPYGSDFTGGVFVAAGDLTGDGVPDIVTGADAGGGPHVQVFGGLTGQSVRSFFAFESTFTGGVRVSLRDIDGDGRADIVTGAGVGGGPAVRIDSGATGALLDGFYATDPDNLGGVYVG